MKVEIVYTVEAKSMKDVEENLEDYISQALSNYGQPSIRRKK